VDRDFTTWLARFKSKHPMVGLEVEANQSCCEESARQAPDEPERAFYQDLANYYGAVATDFRQVFEKRKAA